MTSNRLVTSLSVAARLSIIAALGLAAPAWSQAPAQPTQSPEPKPKATPAAPPAAPAPGRRELFPGVFADLAQRWVEIEGTVPIDAQNPQTPRVYLELLVCTPDSKEHESLVVTRARPEHVHAALLAIGLKPGTPGRFEEQQGRIVPIDPAGDPVAVTVRTRRDGQNVVEPITDWVKHARTNLGLAEASPPGAGLVFAGSRRRMRQGIERYDADGMGTLIGLATFGAEVIAWRPTFSPDSWVEEVVWIADASRVPAFGTPVTVRIAPAPPAPDPTPDPTPTPAPTPTPTPTPIPTPIPAPPPGEPSVPSGKNQR